MNLIKVDNFITLQQALKVSDVISSGGQIKSFLQNEDVFVNDIKETRRGRKLYPGDCVVCNEYVIKIESCESKS